MNRYESAAGIAENLAEEARALVEATAEVTDRKVAAARRRLSETLEGGHHFYGRAQEKVARCAKVTDETLREHPYSSLLCGVGIGFILGVILGHRF